MPVKDEVPSSLSTKVSHAGKVQAPAGSAPSVHHRTVRLAAPLVVTMNEPAVPTVNVAVFALVNEGGAPIVRVKSWLASGETPLVAEIVTR